MVGKHFGHQLALASDRIRARGSFSAVAVAVRRRREARFEAPQGRGLDRSDAKGGLGVVLRPGGGGGGRKPPASTQSNLLPSNRPSAE